MARFIVRPHVSAALAHLTHGVTGSAVIVLVCAVAQMLVFGFAHFTTVRYGSDLADASAQSAPIVTRSPGETAAWREVTVPTNSKSTYTPPPVHIPRPTTPWDAGLNVTSDIAVTAGIIACFLLAAMTVMGAVIAGGAAVPGVERAVSASTWSMLLAAACIPWGQFFESIPFTGVFGTYREMAALCDAVDAGAGSALLMFSSYVLMPIAALACAMMALTRFRTGVEQGIIVTSVSELDERLEREMETIRSRGVTAAGSTRAIGALNQAIGDTAPLTLSPEEPLSATGTTDARPNTGGNRNWLSQRRIGQPNPGDGLQRPI